MARNSVLAKTSGAVIIFGAFVLLQTHCGRDESTEPPIPVETVIAGLVEEGDEAFKARSYDLAEKKYGDVLRYAIDAESDQASTLIDRMRGANQRRDHRSPSEELRVKVQLAAIGRVIMLQ